MVEGDDMADMEVLMGQGKGFLMEQAMLLVGSHGYEVMMGK